MIGNIFTELKHHALFTFFEAITKRSAMLFFQKTPYNLFYHSFYVLHHLMHIVLSALVATSIYNNYKKYKTHQG